MAYDQNGNYYFDPNSDYDDAELVREEQRRQQAKNYVKNQVEFGKKQ